MNLLQAITLFVGVPIAAWNLLNFSREIFQALRLWMFKRNLKPFRPVEGAVYRFGDGDYRTFQSGDWIKIPPPRSPVAQMAEPGGFSGKLFVEEE